MTPELQQLRELVFKEGWDAESRQQVVDYEKRLHELAVKEKMAENAVIKEYINYLTSLASSAQTLLKSDRTLTDRQRDSLFERIDICDKFLYVFNGTARASLEADIKAALARAKSL
jgi:hypothetical protein